MSDTPLTSNQLSALKKYRDEIVEMDLGECEAMRLTGWAIDEIERLRAELESRDTEHCRHGRPIGHCDPCEEDGERVSVPPPAWRFVVTHPPIADERIVLVFTGEAYSAEYAHDVNAADHYLWMEIPAVPAVTKEESLPDIQQAGTVTLKCREPTQLEPPDTTEDQP